MKIIISYSLILLCASTCCVVGSNDQHINVPIDYCTEELCEVNFVNAKSLIVSENSNESFEVIRSPIENDEKIVNMTLILEFMNCDPAKNSYMSIQRDNSIQYVWCTKVDYRIDFSNTKFIAEASNKFTIKRHGDWIGISALLTVTAFGESASGKECRESNDFFCGEKNGKGRCISKHLVCDGHANCGGMNNNEDERCCDYYGYSCHWFAWTYIWTGLFALIFVIIVPAILLYLLCNYRQKISIRRANSRGQNNNITVRDLPNDYPPTYDDVRITEVDPPCFCSALYLSKSGEENVNKGNNKCNCQRKTNENEI